jgi:hypothetical protein
MKFKISWTYKIMAVLKVETDIITSISVSQTRQAIIRGIIYMSRPSKLTLLFSVLHSTWYCTKWSAVIVLLHLTHQVFFVYLDRFLGIVCWFFSNLKAPELIHLCTNSYLHSAAFVKLLCHFGFPAAVFVWCHCNGRRKRLSGKF